MMPRRGFMTMDPDPMIMDENTDRANSLPQRFRGTSIMTFTPPKKAVEKKDEKPPTPIMQLRQFQPKEVLNFGEVIIGQEKHLNLNLHNPSSIFQRVEFDEKKKPNSELGFKTPNITSQRVESKEMYSIPFTFEPRKAGPALSTTYLVTSDGHKLQVTLMGTGVKEPVKPVRKGPNRRGALGMNHSTVTQSKQPQVLPSSALINTATMVKGPAPASGFASSPIPIILEDPDVVKREEEERIRREETEHKAREDEMKRQLELKRIAAAIKIQSCVRGYLVRRDVMRILKAVVTIQRAYRQRLAEKRARLKLIRITGLRNDAATQIQAAFRGFRTRRDLLNQLKATIIIQSYTRRYLVRKDLKLKRNAVMVIQRSYRKHLMRVTIMSNVIRLIRENLQLRTDAAVKIQSAFRGYMTRRDLLNQLKATIIIQSYTRGYLVRKDLRLKRNAVMVIQRSYRKHLLRVTIMSNVERLIRENHKMRTDAATKIQAAFRGFRTRRDLLNQLKATIILQSYTRGYLVRKDFGLKRKAVEIIQRSYRKHLMRVSVLSNVERMIREYHELRTNAAVKIQSAFRGYMTRRDLLKQLKATIVLQSYTRGYLVRKELVLKRNAVEIVQRSFRKHLMRVTIMSNVERLIRENYKMRTDAAVKIQSAFRGYMTRRDLLNQLKATIILQSYTRGYLVRKDLGLKRNAVEIIQRNYRKHLIRVTVMSNVERLIRENHELRTDAATKIQAAFRGFRTRKDLLNQLKATIILQSYTRGYLVRKDLRLKRNAVMVIQRSFRKHLMRVTVMSNVERLIRENEMKTDAAIKIQSAVRGYMTRKDLMNRKNAAIKIQRFYRNRQNNRLILASHQERLGNKTESSLSRLLKYKTYDSLLHDLQTLVTTTKLSPESCSTVTSGVSLKILFRLLNDQIQSLNGQIVVNTIMDILLNLSKNQASLSILTSDPQILEEILNQTKIYLSKLIVKEYQKCREICIKGLTIFYIMLNHQVNSGIQLNDKSGYYVKEIYATLPKVVKREERELKSGSRTPRRSNSRNNGRNVPHGVPLIFKPDWDLSGSNGRREFSSVTEAFLYLSQYEFPSE